MLKLNKLQRLALAAGALIIGVGTASLVLNDGFEGVIWIAGVLITLVLTVLALTDAEKSQASIQLPRKPPLASHNDGTTLERAWPVNAANSVEGIRIEYEIISKSFGKPKSDWNIVNRKLIKQADRTVEHFVLATKAGRREMYFDISQFIEENKTMGDALPLSLHDPILNRIVTIIFLPEAAFNLQNFLAEARDEPKFKEILDERDISKIDAAFKSRRRRNGKDEIIVNLPQMTAIKLAVLLDLLRKDTDVLETQDWLDNCTGAIRYALKAN